MSRRSRRARGDGGEHGGGHERWMASYMDMVTVLMCLFIVLYAMSSIDQDKFVKLKLALSTGFGQVATKTVDTATGVVVPPELIDSTGKPVDPQLQAAIQEVDKLKSLEQAIQASLAAHGVADRVGFEIDQRGLTIKLIGTETFFDGNSDRLRPIAVTVIDSISPVVSGIPNQLSVEGHADMHYNPAPFASVWDLSTSRATSVLRRFAEVDGIPGARLAATGYGSSRPVTTDPSKAELNRRVDIVILSDRAESIRALIPGLLDGSIDPSRPIDPATGKNATVDSSAPADPPATSTSHKEAAATPTGGGTH